MPSPNPLRALLRPFSAFADETPPFAWAVAAVLLVAVVCALGVSASAGPAARHVDATIQVDNPDRPSEGLCRNREQFETLREEMNVSDSSFTEDCDLPETVSFPLGPFARNVVTGQTAVAFLSVAFAWPAVAGLLHLLSGRETDGYAHTLAHTAWGFLPALPRYAALPWAFEQGLAGWSYPHAREPLAAGLRALLAEPGVGWFSALALATLCWQAYVFAGGLAAARGLSRDRALAVVAVPTGVSAAVVAARTDLTLPGTTAAAVVLVLVGLVQIAAPYALEMLDLRTDLIGTRGGRDVEPRAWRVKLTRLTGVGFATAGLWLLGGLGYVV